MVNGQRSKVNGQRSTVNGQWSMVKKKQGRALFPFDWQCRLLLIFSSAELLNVDGLAQLLPSDDALFGEFLTGADFFLHADLVEFLFQFLERFVDGLAFFNGNNNHKKYLFLLIGE
jgi:hypothetical protein